MQNHAMADAKTALFELEQPLASNNVVFHREIYPTHAWRTTLCARQGIPYSVALSDAEKSGAWANCQ
jgi:hypothetical protein